MYNPQQLNTINTEFLQLPDGALVTSELWNNLHHIYIQQGNATVDALNAAQIELKRLVDQYGQLGIYWGEDEAPDWAYLQVVPGGSFEVDLIAWHDAIAAARAATAEILALKAGMAKGDKGDKGDSGVYVGQGDMPEGYNVQIDPDGAVFEMDTKLNRNSMNPVANKVVAREFEQLSYGGNFATDSNANDDPPEEKARVDAQIDAKLREWWHALPEYSVRFFTIWCNGGTVLGGGGNLVRMFKSGESHGMIETSSYQSTVTGSGLRRRVLDGELQPWEHFGNYRVDTATVCGRVSTNDSDTRESTACLNLLARTYLYTTEDPPHWNNVGLYLRNTYKPDRLYSELLPHKSGEVMDVFLGSADSPWTTLYATTGTIQSSARASKENIRNVVSELTPATMGLRDEPVALSDITVETLVDFVRNLQPVTFTYKGDNRQESEQLGLIADDITEHSVYKYIGIDQTQEVEVSPAEYDADGNVVTEAVTEEKRVLGLQALPLAVAALTTCKYLLNQLDNVYAINEDLQSQLNSIDERLKALEG